MLLVELRSGGGVRPTVVICHGAPTGDENLRAGLADRLARAGFSVVSFACSAIDATSQLSSLLLQELEVVLEAVRRGTVGVAAETYALIGEGTGSIIALSQSRADQRVRALVTWATPVGLGGDDSAPHPVSAAGAVRVPWLLVPGAPDGSTLARASVDWLTRHLP